MAGKRYTNARAQVDRERTYPPLDAVRTLKSLDTAKFDETVEMHMRLGVNVRHADQQLRGTLFLPHGTGRSVTTWPPGCRRGSPTSTSPSPPRT
jgi:large subunit ribosomal protein L1